MIGNNLWRLRAASGLSQQALAEKAKIDRRYYQDLEASKACPSVAVAAKLKKAFGCEWDDLLNGL